MVNPALVVKGNLGPSKIGLAHLQKIIYNTDVAWSSFEKFSPKNLIPG
jgi:hypothetical protein